MALIATYTGQQATTTEASMRALTIELSRTISNLRPLALDADFGLVLAGVTAKLAGVLGANGYSHADAIAAEAVSIACRRDGVEYTAHSALTEVVA